MRAVRLVPTPAPGRSSPQITDLPDYLAHRFEIDPGTGDWLWTGPCDRYGYGKLNGRGVHRIVWEILEGPVPEGLVLDHREDFGCRSKTCAFPGHLLPTTHRVNCMREGTGVGAINAAKDECDHGHPFDLINCYWRPNGHRDCRICTARRQREYKARQRTAAAVVVQLARAA